MAEDDDDETFGDFAFAPFQSTSKSTAADDWGDFLNSPQQWNPSDPSSAPGKPAPPLGWTKAHGALPLSISGDTEGEEEEDRRNSGVGWGLDQRKSGVSDFGDFNSNLGGKDAPNSQNLNIADLCNRYARLNPEQGRETVHVGAAASFDDEGYLRFNQNASGVAVGELGSLYLNGKGGVEGQNHLMNNTNRNEDLFGGWTQGSYGISSNLNMSSPNLEMHADLDTKGQKQQLDEFDDEWEFKDAHSEKVDNNEGSNRNTQLSGNVIDSVKPHDVIGAPNGSLDFFLPPPTESVDYFTTSSGFSTTSMGMDFFGNQMGAATPNGWSSDSKSSIAQTKTDNSILNHSPSVGSEEFDEDFGEFTAASVDMESKPHEVSMNDLFTLSKGEAAPTPDGKIQLNLLISLQPQVLFLALPRKCICLAFSQHP